MRILVVENDRLLSEALGRRLTEAGHAVDVFATVADAEAAWKIAEPPRVCRRPFSFKLCGHSCFVQHGVILFFSFG
ncbi:MAG: hypothetical protein Q8K28_01630, partial [Hoeflea sp.]|nr:hypothetical protein [Hoeflea sp.]